MSSRGHRGCDRSCPPCAISSATPISSPTGRVMTSPSSRRRWGPASGIGAYTTASRSHGSYFPPHPPTPWGRCATSSASSIPGLTTRSRTLRLPSASSWPCCTRPQRCRPPRRTPSARSQGAAATASPPFSRPSSRRRLSREPRWRRRRQRCRRLTAADRTQKRHPLHLWSPTRWRRCWGRAARWHRSRVGSSAKGSRSCAGRWPRPSTARSTSSPRRAPGPASRWPTCCRRWPGRPPAAARFASPPTPSPCFYHLSRQRASAADVVVVNHALLLADAFNENPGASRARHLILDEAHHLEEAATKGLTEEIREDDLLGLVGIAGSGRGASDAVTRLDGAVRDLFEALRGACRYLYGNELGRDLRLDEASLETAPMAAVLSATSRVSAALRGLPVGAAAVVEARVMRLVELASRPDIGQVTWAGFGRDGRCTIRRAPLDVGPLLAG